MRHKRLAMLAAISCLLAGTAATIAGAAGASPVAPKPVTDAQLFERGLLQGSPALKLYSRGGEKLVARYTKQGYEIYDVSQGKERRAADGAYQLQGGGTIKVVKGYIKYADELAVKRSMIAGFPVTIP